MKVVFLGNSFVGCPQSIPLYVLFSKPSLYYRFPFAPFTKRGSHFDSPIRQTPLHCFRCLHQSFRVSFYYGFQLDCFPQSVEIIEGFPKGNIENSSSIESRSCRSPFIVASCFNSFASRSPASGLPFVRLFLMTSCCPCRLLLNLSLLQAEFDYFPHRSFSLGFPSSVFAAKHFYHVRRPLMSLFITIATRVYSHRVCPRRDFP